MAELEDYIKKLLKKGYSKGFIKDQLVKAGYEEGQIVPAISSLEEQFSPKDISRKWHFTAALMAVTLAITLTLFFLYREAPVQLCKDAVCLASAANACRPALYYEDIEGTKMLYEIKGCALTKRFTEFGSKEPKELREMLANKAMECPYKTEQFNMDLLDAFGDLEDCRGLLKDTIYEMRLAQESLRG